MIDWTAVFNKIENMRLYCIAQSETDCLPINKTISKTAYNNQFNNLVAAITSYRTDIASKQQNLLDIIMMDFANTLINDINYNPPINKPSLPYPDGYNDYWDLFNMNGLASAILGYATSYFYQGCITTPSGTTSNLQSAIIAANNAESAEVTKRQALITFVRQFPQANSLIFLTENFTITGAPKSKSDTGIIIYSTKHAKEIIQSYGLDIYIPSYIV